MFWTLEKTLHRFLKLFSFLGFIEEGCSHVVNELFFHYSCYEVGGVILDLLILYYYKSRFSIPSPTLLL